MERPNLFLCTFLGAIAFGAGGTIGQAHASTSTEIAEEVHTEGIQAAEEAREDAAAAAFDATATEADPAYGAKIERLEQRIATVRAQKTAIAELPHKLRTTRYRVHDPSKHLLIMLCRKKIQLLRTRERFKLEIIAAREQLAAEKLAGESQGVAKREAVIEKRQVERREAEQRSLQRKQEIHERIAEMHQ